MIKKNYMKNIFILALCAFSLSSFARPTTIIDEGGGLSIEETNKFKRHSQESVGDYSSAKAEAEAEGEGYSDDDLYEQLGVQSISADDDSQYDTTNPHNPVLTDGGRQGYSMGRKGSVSVSCSKGSYIEAGDLAITVVNCDDGVLLANVCDDGANGFNCDTTNSVQVSIDSINQNLSGHPLNGTYSLKAECLNNSCDIDFSSSVEDSFATSASGNLVDANDAKDLHMQEGSYFMDYMALTNPDDPEMADLVNETKTEGDDFADCYQDRLGELNDDGKVRQSCDPNNVDTFQFLVDNRDGPNKGKQMCARTELGSCIEDIEIHERLDHSGTQTCTSQHSKTNGSCTIETTTNTIENNVVDAGGYHKRAASSSSCGSPVFGGVPYKCTTIHFKNYSTYGDNNIGNQVQADNYVLIPLNPRDVHKIRIRSPRFDDYIRAFVGKNKTNSGSSYVINTSNRWGTDRDYKNTSLGWTDVTNSIKGMSSLLTASSFYVNPSLWSVGSGEYNIDVEVIYKKYTTTLSTSDNCDSFDTRNPSSSSVAGCYQTNSPANSCTDSAARSIHGETFNPSCWKYRKDYACYGGIATGCDTSLLQNNGWVKAEEKNKTYPTSATGQNTNQPWKWDEVWTYTGTNNYDKSLGCAPSTSTSHTDATGGTINTTHTWCYKTAPQECKPSPPETPEEITKCHVEDSRSVEKTHGLTTKQEQDYKCETAYVCEGAFGNSVDDESIKPDNTDALAKVMAESEKAKAISESLSDNMSLDENGNVTVFEGEKSTCNKWHKKAFDNLDNPFNLALKELIGNSVGGLNRSARNCCLSDPDKVKLGTNFDNCKDSDIELAAKRMEKAAHLIQFNTSDITANPEPDDDPIDTSLKTVCVVAEKILGAKIDCGTKPTPPAAFNPENCTVTSGFNGPTRNILDVTLPANSYNDDVVSAKGFTMNVTFCSSVAVNGFFTCSMQVHPTACVNYFFGKEGSSYYLGKTCGVPDVSHSTDQACVAENEAGQSSYDDAYAQYQADLNTYNQCKADDAREPSKIKTAADLGSVGAGTRLETSWNTQIANEMARNSSIYQSGQDANGNKKYCYQHLGYSEDEIVYRENGKKYILNSDPEHKDENGNMITKIYLDQLGTAGGSTNVGGEVDTGDSWLPGNRAMCSWFLDSRLRTNPPTGVPASGGAIGTPGTVSVGSWFTDFQEIFNLPFNCQYSIIDAASTIRVDSFQTWCSYDSVFAKLVHEQGRKQLAMYATKPYTGAITDSTTFNFYKNGSGSWTRSKVVNGNDIRFWQWPESCAPRTELVSDFKGSSMMTDQSCPLNADIYVAICPKAGACGNLPANPVLESTGWDVRLLRGEDSDIQALTPLVVVKGNCVESGLCDYDLHAWEKEVGGYVDIPLDLNWQLQSAQSGWAINYNSHNSVHFMAYTYALDENISGGPKLKMCVGSMQDCDPQDFNAPKWETITLESPTSLQGQLLKSSSPRVSVIGQCNESTFNCTYRANIGIKLNAKPWHNGITHDTYSFRLRPKVFGKPIGPKHRTKYNYNVEADCSGFTLDEFLALDIAAMDLSDFTDKVAADAEAKLLEMTTGEADFTDDIETLKAGGTVTKTDTGTTNFTLSPNNGFAGQEVSFKPIYSNDDFGISVSKDGKVFTEKVNTIVIDWGDGEESTIGPSVSAEHTYGDRNNPPAENQIIKGLIKWNTGSGVYSEGFTYKMWMEGEIGDSTAGGGVSVDTPSSGASTVTGGAKSPIKQLQDAPPEIKALNPNNR